MRTLVRGKDDDLLIRADKGANSDGRGVDLWRAGDAEASVIDAVTAGEIDTLLIAGDALGSGRHRAPG